MPSGFFLRFFENRAPGQDSVSPPAASGCRHYQRADEAIDLSWTWARRFICAVWLDFKAVEICETGSGLTVQLDQQLTQGACIPVFLHI